MYVEIKLKAEITTSIYAVVDDGTDVDRLNVDQDLIDELLKDHLDVVGVDGMGEVEDVIILDAKPWVREECREYPGQIYVDQEEE